MGKKNKSNVLYNELYLLMKPYVPGHECFFHRNILPIFQQAVKQENNISYDSLLMLAAVVSGPIEFIDEGLVYWRNVTKRYFRVVSSYPFRQKYTIRTIRYMKTGSIVGILKACCVCCIQHKQLYPHTRFLQSCIKSFFTPLYFIRDCSKFAIH